jgi:hypothetical protein
LIVEIVPLDSIERDRITKLRQYETVGVRAYSMLGHVAGAPRFSQRAADGRFRRVEPVAGRSESVVLPRFRLPAERTQRAPTVEEAVRTLGLRT